MTPQQQAEKLAMEAATEIATHYYNPTITASKVCILSTIPLVELLDAIEALRKAKWWMDIGSDGSCQCASSDHCSYCNKSIATSSKIDKTLFALDAKLKGTK